MAEKLQPGFSRMFCRRCNRPLRHDPIRRDTVTTDSTVDKKGNPVFVHDHCGGKVRMSLRVEK